MIKLWLLRRITLRIVEIALDHNSRSALSNAVIRRAFIYFRVTPRGHVLLGAVTLGHVWRNLPGLIEYLETSRVILCMLYIYHFDSMYIITGI